MEILSKIEQWVKEIKDEKETLDLDAVADDLKTAAAEIRSKESDIRSKESEIKEEKEETGRLKELIRYGTAYLDRETRARNILLDIPFEDPENPESGMDMKKAVEKHEEASILFDRKMPHCNGSEKSGSDEKYFLFT